MARKSRRTHSAASSSAFERGQATPEAAPDLKELHAKIGQQVLEIVFFAGALGKAGLLSAMR
jgi:hypothetical protein